MNWYLGVFKKYAVFEGRARRAEFWYFILISLIVSLILRVIDGSFGLITATGVGILSTIYALAAFLPGLAVSVRRLHDSDRSGWWLLLAFLPLIGGIVLLIFYVLDGTPGSNRFGPDPKGADD